MSRLYKTEKDFLNAIENHLKECGCKTWREVIPDEEKNKYLPLRVDLIFYKEEFGYIAVEGKNFRSLRQGGAFAKGLIQLKKYCNLHYFNGIKINRWCITLPPSQSLPCVTSDENKEIISNEIGTFIQHFIKYMFDFSTIDFYENTNPQYNRVCIDRNNKNSLYISKNEIKGGFINQGDNYVSI